VARVIAGHGERLTSGKSFVLALGAARPMATSESTMRSFRSEVERASEMAPTTGGHEFKKDCRR
jgi:hypothetical protein